MKKRILSILLICCMALTHAARQPAFAAVCRSRTRSHRARAACANTTRSTTRAAAIRRRRQIYRKKMTRNLRPVRHIWKPEDGVQAYPTDARPEANGAAPPMTIEEAKIQFQAAADAMNQLYRPGTVRCSTSARGAPASSELYEP